VKNRVVSNAAWIIGAKIIQSILGVVITMLTARYLGPSNYGVINYASSLVAFVAPIAKLGLDSILVNELINHPQEEGKILGTSIVMSLLSSVLCIAGLVCFTSLANYGETVTIVVCALYSIVLLAHAVELIQYWFQAHLLSKYTSIATLAAYIVKSAYQITLLIRGSSIYWFAVTSAFDVFVIAAIILWLYKKKTGQILSVSVVVAKRMYAQSKYYIVSSMMVTIFANTDRIMINMMLGDAQTGFYSAAVVCASLTSFVFSAIIQSFHPIILENYRKNMKAFERELITVYSIVIWLSLIQSIVIAGFAPLLIRILYGDDFSAASNPLRWIVLYTTFSYIGSVNWIYIQATGNQSTLWKLNLIGAVSNVILNSCLIPLWGVNGAAIASLLTQLLTNIGSCILYKRLRPILLYIGKGINVRRLIQEYRHD